MNRALVLFAGCWLLGCGSTDATATSGTPPPDPNTLSFDLDNYTVKPGDEIKYRCQTFRLPSDKDTTITQIEPLYGQATHHLGVYYTRTDEPDGVFDCPDLFRDNWIPLYGGGVESGTLTMPQGAGVELTKGQQILVQLHLLNGSGTAVTDKATIHFKTTTEKVVPAGVYGFDNRSIKIPAQSQDFSQTMDCPAAKFDMDVFAVFGHMHQLGTKIEMSRGASAGAEVLHSAPWNFNDQPTTPKSFHVSKGDSLHLECWYDNPGANEIDYGESTSSEMCAFVFYYTPYASLNGCLKL